MGAGGRRRTGLILIVIILLVVVLGGVLAFALLGGGGGGEVDPETGQPIGDVPPTEVPTPTPPPTIDIIVAARDIPRGARLTVADVSILSWPDLDIAPPPADALIVDTNIEGLGLEQVEGRIARVDILTNQPVMNFMLTPGDQPTSLADLGSDAALQIPSGFVAMTVPVDRFDMVAYGIRAGDHLDITTSFQFIDVDEDFQTQFPNVATQENVAEGVAGVVTDVFWSGRTESGPFGTVMIIQPSEFEQRPRQSTQLLIDNVVVMKIGEYDLTDLREPIVVVVEPAAQVVDDTAEGEDGAPAPPEEPAEGEAEATPTPLPPKPELMTIIVSRQDALVLKYAYETGAAVDYLLRSALDDDIDISATTTVTLEYIFNVYGLDRPPRLDISHAPRISLINVPLEAPPEEATP